MFGFGKKPVVQKPSEPKAVFVSEAGLVRPDNQDAVLVSVGRRVFCVADGVGGAAEGARASNCICRNVNMMTRATEPSFEVRINAVGRALEESNQVIFEHSQVRKLGVMGSTVAALVFDPDNTSKAAIVWVGDSRVYRIRRGLIERLTRDHREADGSTLTRAIGAEPTVNFDAKAIEARPGDRFLLCTDGVTSVVSDTRIAVFVAGGAIDTAAERLAEQVVKAGAPDNYSFVIVEI